MPSVDPEALRFVACLLVALRRFFPEERFSLVLKNSQSWYKWDFPVSHVDLTSSIDSICGTLKCTILSCKNHELASDRIDTPDREVLVVAGPNLGCESMSPPSPTGVGSSGWFLTCLLDTALKNPCVQMDGNTHDERASLQHHLIQQAANHLMSNLEANYGGSVPAYRLPILDENAVKAVLQFSNQPADEDLMIPLPCLLQSQAESRKHEIAIHYKNTDITKDQSEKPRNIMRYDAHCGYCLLLTCMQSLISLAGSWGNHMQ